MMPDEYLDQVLAMCASLSRHDAEVVRELVMEIQRIRTAVRENFRATEHLVDVAAADGPTPESPAYLAALEASIESAATLQALVGRPAEVQLLATGIAWLDEFLGGGIAVDRRQTFEFHEDPYEVRGLIRSRLLAVGFVEGPSPLDAQFPADVVPRSVVWLRRDSDSVPGKETILGPSRDARRTYVALVNGAPGTQLAFDVPRRVSIRQNVARIVKSRIDFRQGLEVRFAP